MERRLFVLDKSLGRTARLLMGIEFNLSCMAPAHHIGHAQLELMVRTQVELRTQKYTTLNIAMDSLRQTATTMHERRGGRLPCMQ